MKYLLDQGLSRSTVEHLLEMGIESDHVGKLGMAAASDAEILEEGRKQGAVVVTNPSVHEASPALANRI